jgi:predicted site-specific integrase-resolvase
LSNQQNPVGSLVAFSAWLKSLGRCQVTGYRWRKSGIVKTTRAFGRLYIAREEIARFERAAKRGELTPRRASDKEVAK